ncbi:unnamed protein product [Prunus armeniaca]
MRILHARSTGTRTSNVEAAGTPTVVTVDDDSDDGDTTESDADVQNKRTLMTLATCVKILIGTTMMIAMRMHLLIPATIQEDKVVQMLSLGPLVAVRAILVLSRVADIAEGSNLAAAIADPARSPPELSMPLRTWKLCL